MASSENAWSYLAATSSGWFSSEPSPQAGSWEGKERSQMSWAEGWAPARSEPILSKACNTSDLSVQSHTSQALSNHLHLNQKVCVELALPLPPIWAELEWGHQQRLVLINLLIHAASTNLIFLLWLWERKIKEGDAWHGVACSCFIWISESESGSM